MKTRELVRCGLLTGVTVAVLYLGSIFVPFETTACFIAGVSSVLLLLRRARVRTVVLMYLASSVLAFILVPRKNIVLAYCIMCGPYPILKYGIECYIPRFWQWSCKLICANLFLAIGMALAHYVFLIAFSISTIRVWLFFWCGSNVFFVLYDRLLSQLIALLQKRLPPQ